jgi:hypothetical protein
MKVFYDVILPVAEKDIGNVRLCINQIYVSIRPTPYFLVDKYSVKLPHEKDQQRRLLFPVLQVAGFRNQQSFICRE